MLGKWSGDEQAAVVAELVERGIELQGGDIVELGRGIYGLLSQGAHNARPGLRESVSRPLRKFNYGPHPDPRQRAVYVDYVSLHSLLLRTSHRGWR
jgi:hypothetical protein